MNAIQLSDGRSVCYRHDVCKAENAPTIVFVHGFPLDHSMWQGQFELLEYASLLMLDLPGFGNSEPGSGEVSMKGYADTVADLLKQLGISKVIFCGLSMGGYIGWEFARHHGELLDGLICCNTRAAADDEITARARRVAASQVIEDGAGPTAEAMKEKLFSTWTKSRNVELVNRVAEVIRGTNPETIAAAQLGMSKRADSTGFLNDIEVKTLVIVGVDDVITPSVEMQEMSILIDEATFVEIPEAGHLSPAEQSEAFNNAVIHWLC